VREMLSDPYFAACDERLEWLRDKRNGWQFGEQGLIDAIVGRLNTVLKVGVEIGGGDGVSLPLTLERLYWRSWHIIAYESDQKSREKLSKHRTNLEVREAYAFEGCPDCSVLVIDIDGADSLAMSSALMDMTPSLLVVEHYDKAGPFVTAGEASLDEPVPEWLLGMPLGIPDSFGFVIQSPSEHLDDIAASYSMVPVCRTRVNSFYVPEWLAEELHNV